MQKLTHTLLARKTLLIRLIWLVITLFTLFFLWSISLNSPQTWLSYGRKSGETSAILFLIVLTPGILKRFRMTGLLLDLQLVLMAVRRQLGISMYLTAIFHSLWVKNLALLKSGLPLAPGNFREILGVLALFLLTPLFLTSNDTSQRLLGKTWNTLHKLVYLINWLIFGHVALLPGKSVLATLYFAYAVLEISSFIYRARTTSNNQTE